MVGAIIGAGLSAVGSVVGGIMSSKAAKEARDAQLKATREATDKRLAAQNKVIEAAAQNQREARNSYYANLSAPRYAVKAVLDQTAEKVRQRNAARRGAAKLGMTTTAAAQAGAAQDLEALGNAEQMAVNQGLDEQRQARQQMEASDRQYRTQLATLNAGTQEILANGALQQAGISAQYNQARANATAQATAGVIGAAGSIAGAVDGGSAKKTAKTETPEKPVVQPKGSEIKVGGKNGIDLKNYGLYSNNGMV